MPTRGYRFSTFTYQVGRVKWEVLGAVLLISSTRVPRVARHGRSFHSGREGWFGRNTYSLGMDKMHHAWKTYVLTDLLQSAIEQRTGDRKGAAITSGLLGLGLMTYGEIYDGFSHSGFSHEDEVVHLAGAGFSVLRNMVPGMRNKVDFRMMWAPPGRGHDRFNLRNQLAHRKYLFALQLAGFKKWERSPMRFVELHFGYYARGFTAREQAEGHRLRRRLYFGVGFNVQALFARHPEKRVEQIAKGAFDYIQVPYTEVEVVH